MPFLRDPILTQSFHSRESDLTDKANATSLALAQPSDPHPSLTLTMRRCLVITLESHPMESWLGVHARPMQHAAATRQLWERLLSSLAQGKLAVPEPAAPPTAPQAAAGGVHRARGESRGGGGGSGLPAVPSNVSLASQVAAWTDAATAAALAAAAGGLAGITDVDRAPSATGGSSSIGGDSSEDEAEEGCDGTVRFKSIFQSLPLATVMEIGPMRQWQQVCVGEDDRRHRCGSIVRVQEWLGRGEVNGTYVRA